MNQAATLEKLQNSKVAEYLSEKLFQNLKAHRHRGKQCRISELKRKTQKHNKKTGFRTSACGGFRNDRMVISVYYSIVLPLCKVGFLGII